MRENKYLYFGKFEDLEGIILESRGGASGSVNERNSNYKENLDKLIGYLISTKKNKINFYLAADKRANNNFTDIASRVLSIEGKTTFDNIDLTKADFRVQLNRQIKTVGTLNSKIANNSTRRLFVTFENMISDFTSINSTDEELEYVYQKIKKRIKQNKFRKDLLIAYDNTCAVTGSKVNALLEAAHIIPYFGEKSNLISNGILLRSDIHDLFDQYLEGKKLLDISKDYVIEIHPSLVESEYWKLNGKKILLPSNKEFYPVF